MFRRLLRRSPRPLDAMRTSNRPRTDRKPPFLYQLTTWVLVCLQLTAGLPVGAAVAELAALPAPSSSTVPSPLTGVRARQSLPAHRPASERTKVSAQPTDGEVGSLRLFPSRLRPLDSPPESSPLQGIKKLLGNSPPPPPSRTVENEAVAPVLRSLQENANGRDTRDLQNFITAHPKSRWTPALRHELARRWFAQGHFTRAVREWEAVWTHVKDLKGDDAVALGDEVLSNLLETCLGLSDVPRLTQLIGEAESRPGSNGLEGKLERAKQSVWLLKHKGGQNVLCGPLALYSILRHQERAFTPIRLDTITDDYIATGLPLTELQSYSERYQLGLVMARRAPGAEIPVPSVMHSVGQHYSTLVERDGDQFFLVDRAMQFEGWVDRQAIEEQSSGYFLIPATGLKDGWASVTPAEGRRIFGRDGLHGQEPNGPNSTPCGESAGGSGGSCCGMPRYTFNVKLAGVRITDTPVWHNPPVGPAVHLTLTYADLDDSKPATSPGFSNAGRVWATDWIAWIDHVPGNLTASSRVTVHVSGGGTEISRYTTAAAAFGPNDRSFATVKRTGTSTYTRTLPDGSTEVYDTPDNPQSPNRVFLTRKLDPAGNTITFTYDANLKLVGVTDAIGQVTTLDYGFAADPWKITRVTDPFGRFAALEYDASGRLSAITDMIGLRSTFTYDATEFITSMTTPYGTTTFTKIQGSPAYNRTVTATDPMGGQERIQFIEPVDIPTTAPAVPSTVTVGGKSVPFRAETTRLGFRNSFFWSKLAMKEAPGDLRVARNYRWFTDGNYLVTGVLESVKEPLEDPVWFNYPGQGSGAYPYYAGAGATPEKILRVLPDGTPQLIQNYYNSRGRLTNQIDPAGRSTVLVYATNLVDLIEVRQQVSTNRLERLARFTHTPQHRLASYTDAAGSTTTYTYNSRSQPLTISNAKGETVTFNYDPNGYLLSIDGPLPGNSDSGTFTYDALGRVRTVTNLNGYKVTFDYDALNRPTVITYPDGTTEQFTYDKLDRVTARDRLGRISRFTYDARRQLVQAQDALGRVLRYDWCQCGNLSALIDPLNRTTSWQYDVQGRTTSKTYPDGSRTQYQYETSTSRLRQIVDPKGQFLTMEYNVDNSLRQTTYPNATVPTPGLQLTYDPIYPRLAAMIDGSGTTTYSYHPIADVPAPGAGALALVDGPLPDDTVRFGYDSLGRVVRRAVGNAETAVELDALGRLVAQTNVLGRFTYTYNGATPELATVAYPNGVISTLSYLPNTGDRRLSQIRHSRGGTTLSQFDYTYDSVGNILSWKQQADSSPVAQFTFGYDSVSRLTNAVIAQTGAADKRYGYAYDPADNRTRETIDGVARQFSYNALNELASSSTPPLADATYEWDGANRLAAVVRGTKRSEFSYDGAGRRIRVVEKENGAVVQDRRFVWCGLQICEERDATGAIVVKRFTAEGVQTLQGPNAGNFLYTKDHLGSIREMTDASGTIKARFVYDPWGRRSRTQGTLESDFGFTGHWTHAATGLTMAPYRAYDAEAGRWLNRDPLSNAELLGEGPNLFGYVGNNPVGFVDPTGEFIPLLIAIGAGLWTVAEIGLSIYDAYDTTRTILDPCVGAWAKVIAGGLFIAGIFLPGGGYSKIDDIARQAARATRESVDDKLARYLLNPDHPVGGSKARWFEEALGYTRANADDLAKQLTFDPTKAVQTAVTEHGTKFNQIIDVVGANGRTIPVKVAWIRNNDGVVRIVTAVPGN